ncbi:hypothetical protein TWF696_004885 [Orbilia brochopaga]|uniref:Uncharacterized protein n=1 Tax=Orbilia brochopaga TaxID=3140254 RepID=A0AAV9V2B3_9PEZI
MLPQFAASHSFSSCPVPTPRHALRFFIASFVASLLLLLYIYPQALVNFDHSTASHMRWNPPSRPVYPHFRQMHDDPSLLRTVFRTEADDRPRHSPHTNLTLILTITNDTASWGRMTWTGGHKWQFSDFIERLKGQGLPPSSVHLGMLVSDEDAYASYVDELASATDLPFARAEILYAPSLPTEPAPSQGYATRAHRHSREGQNARRRHLARVRNFLSSQVLTPAVKHVIWLDADVYELPSGLFTRFIDLGSIPIDQNISNLVKNADTASSKQTKTSVPTSTSAISRTRSSSSAAESTGTGTLTKRTAAKETKSQTATSASLAASSTPQGPLPIGLLTLRCETRRDYDYDRNAWAGFGHRPTRPEAMAMTEGRKFPGMEKWAKALSQLIEGTGDDELVHLDAVGGTALYIRADLLREGLSFPAYLVSGAKWGKDGDDGVETEGLCYIAERMGYGCYTLGGQWRTKHSDA